MPVISLVYVSRLLWWRVGEEWGTLLRKNLSAGPPPVGPELMEFLVDMGDYHAAICGTKCWTSWAGADAIEQVRRSMGGHAYSAYNGIGALAGEFAVTTTGAGDNIVLAQQSGRYNVQILRRIRQSKVSGRLGKSVAYFKDFKYAQNSVAALERASTDAERLKIVLSVLTALAFALSSRALDRVEEEMKTKGVLFDDACKTLMMDLVQVSRAQTAYYTLTKVLQVISDAEELQQSSALKNVVLQVTYLYSLQQTLAQLPEIIELGRILSKSFPIP